jgi:hypothetical protein
MCVSVWIRNSNSKIDIGSGKDYFHHHRQHNKKKLDQHHVTSGEPTINHIINVEEIGRGWSKKIRGKGWRREIM